MTERAADVVVVGAGLMGSIVAAEIVAERPGTRVLVLDAGPVIGSLPGQHLHDTPEEDVYRRYNENTSSGVQGFYAGADTADARLDPSEAGLIPGMYDLARMDEDPGGMPGASLSWNLGGMGVHWTAACPTPWGSEVFAYQGQQQWDRDLVRAGAHLRVTPDAFGVSRIGRAVMAKFADVYARVSAPGRHPQTMPMAIEVGADGRRRRTGPNRILPETANVNIRANAMVTRIHHEGGQVHGVTVRDPRTGEEESIAATELVVCADALRTPQVLFASGIRPAALGSYLNEHVFLAGRVLISPDDFALGADAVPEHLPGEWATGAYWLPQSGPEQPFHAQLMDRIYAGEGYGMGLSWYVPTEVRSSNRVVFSDGEVDAAGMPRMHVEYALSDVDLALLETAKQEQRHMGEMLGAFDPERDSGVLPAGSSLHFTGTVRMGEVDDGTSVVDPECRVWGFENLRLAGNGVIPTSMAGNVTLTGAVTAVMAARSVVGALQVAAGDRVSV